MPDVSSSPTVSAQVMAEARPVKTGLAFIASLDKSTSAGESDGFAGGFLIAAVTVDGDGRITSCVIDAVEIKAFSILPAGLDCAGYRFPNEK